MIKMQGQLSSGVQKVKYPSIISSVKTILLEEGLRGLFSGLLSASVGSFLSTLAYFACYESLKRKFIDDYHINPTVSYLMAGGVGDTVSSVLYVPSEVVKQRLQMSGMMSMESRYTGSVDAFLKILERRGIRGLYYGWGATMLRDVPFTAIQFALFENTRAQFIALYNGDEARIHTYHDMVAGSFAGVVAGVITTPLDVCKTYLMTQQRSAPVAKSTTARPASVVWINNGESKLPQKKPKAQYYGGVFDAFRGIYKTSGIKGLFAGVGPRCLWTGCQSMIMFVV
jgi:hypothetical protein